MGPVSLAGGFRPPRFEARWCSWRVGFTGTPTRSVGLSLPPGVEYDVRHGSTVPMWMAWSRSGTGQGRTCKGGPEVLASFPVAWQYTCHGAWRDDRSP